MFKPFLFKTHHEKKYNLIITPPKTERQIHSTNKKNIHPKECHCVLIHQSKDIKSHQLRGECKCTIYDRFQKSIANECPKILDTPIHKTIIHVLDYTNGIGDYLRGSICLAQLSKRYHFNFKMDTSHHHISKCLNTYTEPSIIQDNITIVFHGNNAMNVIYDMITSDKEINYITTNAFYDKYVSNEIKHEITSMFTFKKEYYDKVNELIPFEKYNVLHIRCTDDKFNTSFEDYNLITEIIKLQLNDNTIVMSNNNLLKNKLNKIFGFHFIDMEAEHSAKISSSNQLYSTIIDYIILSKSSRTHCFSYYGHGSGFSEQCSVLYNVPYTMVYITEQSIPQNNDILINHYNDLLYGHYTQLPIQSYDNYDNIDFITLTNAEYINYTLNCLESLKPVYTKPLHVYCIGEEGYSILNDKHVSCGLIHDNEATNSQEFITKNWYKFQIIYNHLLQNEYVCITDGDIVYEKNIFDYLLSNIGDNDLLIQSEGIHVDMLCSGFMFIKSNETTRDIFNPDKVQPYRNVVGWDDQVYINTIKHKLKFKKLPLKLFPTGKYYYEYTHNIISPYLIHFNGTVGHEKIEIMKKYNKWYI